MHFTVRLLHDSYKRRKMHMPGRFLLCGNVNVRKKRKLEVYDQMEDVEGGSLREKINRRKTNAL
jgi:hypothetical protein